MINQVTLVGRITKDPELRYTGDGVAVSNFTLALNRNFKNANGGYDTDYVNCNIWRKPAETVANFCLKGSLIGITGRLHSRHYDNSEGKRIYVTEVVAEDIKFISLKNNKNTSRTNDTSHDTNTNNNTTATFVKEEQSDKDKEIAQ